MAKNRLVYLLLTVRVGTTILGLASFEFSVNLKVLVYLTFLYLFENTHLKRIILICLILCVCCKIGAQTAPSALSSCAAPNGAARCAF